MSAAYTARASAVRLTRLFLGEDCFGEVLSVYRHLMCLESVLLWGVFVWMPCYSTSSATCCCCGEPAAKGEARRVAIDIEMVYQVVEEIRCAALIVHTHL